MPRYRVHDAAILPHNGTLLEGGAIVELPRHVADDPNIRGLVYEVDAAGQPVDPPIVDVSLAPFRPHERLGMLQARLVEAQARVAAIATQLAAEDHAEPTKASRSDLTPAASRGLKE